MDFDDVTINKFVGTHNIAQVAIESGARYLILAGQSHGIDVFEGDDFRILAVHLVGVLERHPIRLVSRPTFATGHY
jgi:hypothetical protein